MNALTDQLQQFDSEQVNALAAFIKTIVKSNFIQLLRLHDKIQHSIWLHRIERMKLECCAFCWGIIMLQSTSEYEERNLMIFVLDIEHTVKALEAQLCYDQHSPEEVAWQILKAACKFYDADWCGLIQVDLDLKIWTHSGITIVLKIKQPSWRRSLNLLNSWPMGTGRAPWETDDRSWCRRSKNTYPAEYNLYQRLGIRSVLGASLEPRPVASLCGTQSQQYISRNEYSAAVGVCSSRYFT